MAGIPRARRGQSAASSPLAACSERFPLIDVTDDWLSVRDVARKLGKSEPTVLRVIRGGALPAYVFGERGYLVAPSDLQSFIAKCRTDSGDAAGGAAGSSQDLLTKSA